MNCNCTWTGLSTCHCAGCHRTFTSVTAFDMHQRIQDGRNVCLDPAVMRKGDGTFVMAVLRKTPDGQPVWGGGQRREGGNLRAVQAPRAGNLRERLNGPEISTVHPGTATLRETA
jgi:hypothetical protein